MVCLIIPTAAQSDIYTPTDADQANTTERIINFHADIEIKPDGNLTVTEYLTIYAGGIDIQRGIIRNIPKNRVDTAEIKRKSTIKVISLTRNGEKSDYHTEMTSDYNEFLI